jgi:hypothetical protein
VRALTSGRDVRVGVLSTPAAYRPRAVRGWRAEARHPHRSGDCVRPDDGRGDRVAARIVVEQVRAIGAEPPAAAPDGIEFVTVTQRPELWDVAYERVGPQGFADMALTAPL